MLRIHILFRGPLRFAQRAALFLFVFTLSETLFSETLSLSLRSLKGSYGKSRLFKERCNFCVFWTFCSFIEKKIMICFRWNTKIYLECFEICVRLGSQDKVIPLVFPRAICETRLDILFVGSIFLLGSLTLKCFPIYQIDQGFILKTCTNYFWNKTCILQ